MRSTPPAPAPVSTLGTPPLLRAAAAPRDSRDRGAAMACWMIARLAATRLTDAAERPPLEALRTRGEAARQWCEALPLPASARAHVARACVALGDESPEVGAQAIDAVRAACTTLLDDESDAMLAALGARLRAAATAAMPRP